jgi:hypothetical protein
MIITRKYALSLIRAKKAVVTTMVNEDKRNYMAMDRVDLQRVDHYPVAPADYKSGLVKFNGKRSVCTI